ncbi:MAG: metallophosphoesterase family protein, partial [Rudanella sp.]|nr:metallophosphoesterase family protein [Rudanella sp.]
VSQTVGATVYDWTDTGYDDSSPTSWSSGPSELGYGDGGESTTVTSGPTSSTTHYITTYFRKTFSNAAILTHYRYKVRYIRDDGIILYLNGIEIRRDGMPDGTITNSTPATLLVGGTDESTWYEFYLPNGAVRQGNNVLAAEIHQVGPSSSDISFNAELIGEINSNTLIASTLPVSSSTTTNWKYSDGGTDQGTAWRALAYNDQYWQQTNIGSVARNRMGYGETTDPNAGVSSINTATANPFNANTYTNYVSFGIDPGNRFPTTYFRKKVTIASPALAHELRFMRDDGIVIHINGVELPRDVGGNTNNMPAGTASYPTQASAAADAAGETTWSNWQPVSSSLLVPGENIIAVEIHQVTAFSSDITFNLEMRVQGAATITRGPYLQLGGQTAATIRWRTDVANVGQVTYGLATSALSGTVTEPGSTTEHELRITGLTADQTYFYSVGTTTMVLEQGPNNYFLTAPPADTKEKIRIASFGDCGNNYVNDNQNKVRDGFLNYRGNTPTDLWMLIGDNSYDGADSQFQTNFFNPYKDNLLKNCMLYAVPGNHDYNDNRGNEARSRGGTVTGLVTGTISVAAFPAFAYFANFTLPTTFNSHSSIQANTEEWYSFDYGPIHFVMLDSYGTQEVGGVEKRLDIGTDNHPQIQWLKADLAATTKKWKIVYMHFPPYSKGSHNSDTEADLIPLRSNLNPILEGFGVDLVLTGHSHGYERSYPIHDQYEPTSSSLITSSNINNYRFPGDESTGRYDGSPTSCAYKNTSAKTKQGTIYVVSGSAGALHTGTVSLSHSVMASDASLRIKGGSFYMEIEDNRLDAKFLQVNDASPYTVSVTDQVTIMKDVDIVQTLTLSAGQSATLTASFISDYVWSSPGNATFTAPASRTVVVSPTTSQTFVVKDSKQCIVDVFMVQICSGPLYSVKAGNWNDPTIWSCNRIPLSTDHVQVKHNILVPTNLQAHALKVQFDPNTKLTYGANARLLLSQ